MRWRYGHGRSGRAAEDSADDHSATVFGSPLTPPPNFWLHDVDVANPASYATPPPEPLLFSLSPGLGGGHAGGAPQPAPLRTMQSAAGQAALGASGAALRGRPFAGAGMYGSPDGDVFGMQPHHHLAGVSSSVRGGRRPADGGRSTGSGGWDRALLSRQAALLPAISSLEGLMASAEFQEHVRCTRRRSPFLEREQSQARVQLYKDLRRLDPDAFRRLMSRDDIRTYDVRPPSLVFALADYVLGVLLVALALLQLWRSEGGSPLLRYGPLCIWLAVRLHLAARGHVSLTGRAASAYLVYDMPDDAQPGNAWEGLVGVGGHLLLELFELMMAGLSCGLLAVGAMVSIAMGGRRQTLAMRLLGLRLELETDRPTKLSPFSPSSDNATSMPSHNKASSRRSLESLPGRYGLSLR